MNFDEVNKHVAKVNVKKLQASNKDKAMANLCPAYKAVKPILVMVTSIPFFPPKWKTVVTQFMTLLDLICP